MKIATKVIHSGLEIDPSTGAIITPIYQTSTYVQKKPGDNMGFEYSRTSNPTRAALEKNIAALENGKHCNNMKLISEAVVEISLEKTN